METFTKDQVIRTVSSMCEIIIENEVPFCELDSVAGDGDFGMSLAKGFKVVQAQWDEHSRDDIGATPRPPHLPAISSPTSSASRICTVQRQLMISSARPRGSAG